jgi:hypothetical protein
VSIALTDLVTRLQADVPARDGAPSTTQYENAVKDAVRDYSRRRPMTRVTTISIVSGTATYALPDDFLFEIKLDVFEGHEGILHTSNGIVPLSSDWNERHTVNGRTITVTPTPNYTIDRSYRYAAGHVLDASDSYPYLTEADVAILILKAQALALRTQALSLITSGSGEITEYQVGDERVKKSSPSAVLRAQADALEQAYQAAILQAVGPVGRRARYNVAGRLR